MTEVWKPIPSVPGYEASDLGRVRSVAHGRPGKSRTGNPIVRRYKGQLRKPYDNGAGYMHLHLTKGMHRYVHRLVAEAFIGPRPDGMWVCHVDGNPSNNRADNLRYDTAQNNEADKRRHGTRRSKDSHYAVLTELQVRAIRELHPKFSQSQLAKIFTVSQPTISRIISGFCWNDIGNTHEEE